MEILSYLTSVTARSLCLAVAVLLGAWLLRARTAAARHATYALLAAGMLLMAAFTATLPPIPVRVLGARSVAIPNPPAVSQVAGEARPVVLSGPNGPVNFFHFDWRQAAAVAYAVGALIFLLRLTAGYLLILRLARASLRVGESWQSNRIVAPVTVGWLRPKILLPEGWVEWDRDKLTAVLAHERMHVRRGDWAVAALAAVNRCLFWFNPLTWWVERRLAVLAEQACDDAAVLATGARQVYAQALLDMAAAVRTARGRLSSQAMAMAKASEVRQRVERILDETRQIPRGLTKRRLVALASCAMAISYLAAMLQLAPAQTKAATIEEVGAKVLDFRAQMDENGKLTPADAGQLEGTVAADPENLPARTRLIFYYLAKAMNAQRAKHVLWMIEHHPEAEVFSGPLLFGEPGPLGDGPSYNRAAELWRNQAALHAGDLRVVLNAAHFFDVFYAGNAADLFQWEQWVGKGRELEPANSSWTARLAMFYSAAIWSAAGGAGAANTANPSFAEHARAVLETSNDGPLCWHAGRSLENMPAGDAPQLKTLNEFGRRLRARAEEQLAYRPPNVPTAEDTTRAAAQRLEAERGPEPLRRVDPVYPPAAMQARIQATVRLRALIAKNGTVNETEVTSGHPLLIQAARDAVRQWAYPPQAMETLVEVDVPFQLPPPGFEVASVRQSPPLPHDLAGGLAQIASGGVKIDPGRASFVGVSLTNLIAFAYRIRPFQIDGPAWMSKSRYDVLAKLPEGASTDSAPEMLQALLVDRFKLVVHHRDREFEVYVLSLGDGGSRLQPTPGDYVSGGNNDVSSMTMERYSTTLSQALGYPVLDQTEIKGEFLAPKSLTVTLLTRAMWMHLGAPAQAQLENHISVPPEGKIIQLVREQGLKLELRKVPLNLLVIERAEKTPTEN
jgi:uncharacterized protein (TIGR03435 family)